MQEASQPFAHSSPGIDVIPTQTRLISCTEALSISSNAVITRLNNATTSSEIKEPMNPKAPTNYVPSGPSMHPLTYDSAQASHENTNTWASKRQNSLNIRIKNHSSPSISPEGIPRVKILSSVFQRSADLHKDFILGVFMGKTPSYGYVQSVLSHIWGRGMKLEIHVRPTSRSMLVRIPNSSII